MSRKKQLAVEANPGLDPENCERLERLMMDFAERKPELEAPILQMARECGLARVVSRIQRLRKYARTRKG